MIGAPELLFWALAVAGSALVLTQSSITAPWRNVLTALARRAEAVRARRRFPWPCQQCNGLGQGWIKPSAALVGGVLRPLSPCPACGSSGENQHPRRPSWLVALTARPLALLAKLVACPMCSGAWIGTGWAGALGIRWPWVIAFGFAGSYAAAIGVAAWQLATEAHAALALWRYLRTPPPPTEKENP